MCKQRLNSIGIAVPGTIAIRSYWMDALILKILEEERIRSWARMIAVEINNEEDYRAIKQFRKI